MPSPPINIPDRPIRHQNTTYSAMPFRTPLRNLNTRGRGRLFPKRSVQTSVYVLSSPEFVNEKRQALRAIKTVDSKYCQCISISFLIKNVHKSFLAQAATLQEGCLHPATSTHPATSEFTSCRTPYLTRTISTSTSAYSGYIKFYST